MLPIARSEAEIERAISDVRKILNAAENSNQTGENVIVIMAKAVELWEMAHTLCVEMHNHELIERLDQDLDGKTSFDRAVLLLGVDPKSLEVVS